MLERTVIIYCECGREIHDSLLSGPVCPGCFEEPRACECAKKVARTLEPLAA